MAALAPDGARAGRAQEENQYKLQFQGQADAAFWDGGRTQGGKCRETFQVVVDLCHVVLDPLLRAEVEEKRRDSVRLSAWETLWLVFMPFVTAKSGDTNESIY